MASTPLSGPASEYAASEPPGPAADAEGATAAASPRFPPYPPHVREPPPPSVADAVVAGKELRGQRKSRPVRPVRPPPRPAKPKGPKATDVKMARRATRAQARCLRRHGAVLTDRLERLAKPPRRNVIYLWRENAHTLPAETIGRLRGALDADEPFKPDQAYEYFTNLRNTKRNATARGVTQLKKELASVAGDKRFEWARDATVAFARGLQRRLARPGRYALADGMLRLSDIVLEEMCSYLRARPPARRSAHPRARFMLEMADKAAVWIDEILSESDDRMLMMDFDEDEDMSGADEGRSAGFTDDFLNMMAGGRSGRLTAPKPAHLKFSGPMAEAFKILIDAMARSGSKPLLARGKFSQTHAEAVSELKAARDFSATQFDSGLANQISASLWECAAPHAPRHLTPQMKDMVNICANYLAQNAENNKEKGPAFKLLLKSLRSKPNEQLYQKGKVRRTNGQAATELEQAAGLDADHDDPNLAQEIHSNLTKLVAPMTPSELKTDIAETLNAASKYLSQKAVVASERGPAFDLAIKELEMHGGEPFTPEHRHLQTKAAAAHALKTSPGMSGAVADPATAPKFAAALHRAVDASTPDNMKKEMNEAIGMSSGYLSALARDRDKALKFLLDTMNKTPPKELVKRNSYAMDYGTGAKELETAPSLASHLPVKDIADEIAGRLAADVEAGTPPNLAAAMKALVKDAGNFLSQTVALKSGAAGDNYAMKLLAAADKSLGDRPLYKHEDYGQSYAEAGDDLQYAGPAPPEPRNDKLKQEIAAKMKQDVPLSRMVTADMQGTIDDASKHLAKRGEDKGAALKKLVGLMKEKGDAFLANLQGYPQTYADATRRIEGAPSLANDHVDRAAYETVRGALTQLAQASPSAEHATTMPGIVEEVSKFLAAPFPEKGVEKRRVLADLMARRGDDMLAQDGPNKITYREGGNELINAPVGVTTAHDEAKRQAMLGKINAIIPDKKLQEGLKDAANEGAAHLTDILKAGPGSGGFGAREPGAGGVGTAGGTGPGGVGGYGPGGTVVGGAVPWGVGANGTRPGGVGGYGPDGTGAGGARTGGVGAGRTGPGGAGVTVAGGAGRTGPASSGGYGPGGTIISTSTDGAGPGHVGGGSDSRPGGASGYGPGGAGADGVESGGVGVGATVPGGAGGHGRSGNGAGGTRPGGVGGYSPGDTVAGGAKPGGVGAGGTGPGGVGADGVGAAGAYGLVGTGGAGGYGPGGVGAGSFGSGGVGPDAASGYGPGGAGGYGPGRVGPGGAGGFGLGEADGAGAETYGARGTGAGTGMDLSVMSEVDRRKYLSEKKRLNALAGTGYDSKEEEHALEILHRQLKSRGNELLYKQPQTELTHAQASDWLAMKPPMKVDKMVKESGDTGRLTKKLERKLGDLVKTVTPNEMRDVMEDVIIESSRKLSEYFVSQNYKSLVREALIAEMQKRGNEILIEVDGAAETAFFAAQRLKNAKSMVVKEPCNQVAYYLSKKMEEMMRCRSMPRKLSGAVREHTKEAADYLSELVTKPDEKIEAYVCLLDEMEAAGDGLLIEGHITKSYKDAAAYLRQLTSSEDVLRRGDAALQAEAERRLRALVGSAVLMHGVISECTKLLVSYIVLQVEKTEALKLLLEQLQRGGECVLLRHGRVLKTYADGAALLRGKNTDQLGVASADPVAARKIQIKLNNLMHEATPDKYKAIMNDVIEDTTMYLAVYLLQPQTIKVCKCMNNVFVQCELWCEEILRRVSRPCCTCSRHVSTSALAELAPAKRLQLSPGSSRAFAPHLEISLEQCPAHVDRKEQINDKPTRAACPAPKLSGSCGARATSAFLLHTGASAWPAPSSEPSRLPPQTPSDSLRTPRSRSPLSHSASFSPTRPLLRTRSPSLHAYTRDTASPGDNEQHKSDSSHGSFHTPLSTNTPVEMQGVYPQNPTVMYVATDDTYVPQSRTVHDGDEPPRSPGSPRHARPVTPRRGRTLDSPRRARPRTVSPKHIQSKSKSSARAAIVTTDQISDWHAMMVSLMWNVQAWRDWIQDIIDRALAFQRQPGSTSQEAECCWAAFHRRVATEALQWRQYNMFSRQLTLRLALRYRDKEIVSPTRATVKTDNYMECQKEMMKIIAMFNRWTHWLIVVMKETQSLKPVPGSEVPMYETRCQYLKKKIEEYSKEWSKYNLHLKICWEQKYKQIMSDWLPTGKQPGPVWVMSACGAVPSGAVAAGVFDGELTWVARTTHRCRVLPAALLPSKHCCLVHADGAVHHYTKYQVMCNAEAVWVAWRAGAVGARAVRVEAGVHVGRVLYRGAHLVGAVLAPQHRCHVVIFGRPFAFNCYELLVLANVRPQRGCDR